MSQALRLGRVILVGAGPGHPGLLTLRGAEVLAACDAVLYDELSAQQLLELAPAHAERINVGKRGHDAPTRSQEDISKLLIERARRGDTVVRLKGGDPFVFGRGGEEATACVEAGVPFEVVPGVSAAVAALSFAGIPVTDRRHAASFAVVTGHKDPTRVAVETRWGDLGRAVDTLVILMGMRNLAGLVEKIIEGGLAADTPSAAVMFGTLPQQRVVAVPLHELPAAVAAAGLSAPSAVVIGKVTALRATLSWWEQMPLFGAQVLVTRAAEQAGGLVRGLMAAGAEPVVVPTIAFAPPDGPESAILEETLRDLNHFDGVIFASTNAVHYTARAARACGVDLARSTARLLCVGQRTARALVERDLPVHMAASPRWGGGAEGLVKELVEAGSLSGKRFLIPRSQLGREILGDALREAGAEVVALTAYRNVAPVIDGAGLSRRIAEGELQVLTFTSPSTVHNLLAALDAEARAALPRCIVAALGQTTADALRAEGIEPTVVPDKPDVDSLVQALANHASGLPRDPAAKGGNP